jgi:ferredoxin
MLIDIFTVALLLLLLSVCARVIRVLPVLFSKRTDIRGPGLLLPFRRMYAGHRSWVVVYYAFHVLIIFVPLTVTGHLLLMEESFLGWSWFSTPDAVMDGLTLLVMAACAAFFVRNLLTLRTPRELIERQLFLVLVALPFSTGYLLSNTAVLSGAIFEVHVAASILLVVGLIFSSIRVKIDAAQCVGCISCSMSCPSEALDVQDRDLIRTITYRLSRCLNCGTCLVTCPYHAIRAYHGFSISKHLPGTRTDIARLDLCRCVDCGKVFSTDRQLVMVGRSLELENGFLEVCPECRGKRMMVIANATARMPS